MLLLHPATADVFGGSCCRPLRARCRGATFDRGNAVESYEPAASVTVAELATMVLSETVGL